MSNETCVNTFYILACETCGKYRTPPPPLDLDGLIAPTREPMRCVECDGILLLAECFVALETSMWQRVSGDMWKHVIYPETLPRGHGNHRWIKA